MRRQSLWAPLLGIVLLAAVALGGTFAAGRSVLLGLDLRGGVSVVLKPQGRVNASILDQAIAIIDRRVNGLGVSNSSVQRQGNEIDIELPGAKNSQQALKVIGATAQLYFRPVYCTMPAYTPASKTAAATTGGGTTKSGVGASIPARLTSSTASRSSAAKSASSKGATGTGAGLSVATCGAANAASIRSTSPDADLPNRTVLLPSSSDMGVGNVRWLLGPATNQAGIKQALSGRIVKSASAVVDATTGQDVVNVTLTSKGLAEFNKVAALRNATYNKSTPNSEPFSSREAIELDGVTESAPTIVNPVFTGQVQITGNFTSKQATDLATQLNYGSLPVRFNPQTVNTVSATIGEASLKAGLLAGIGGIILVLLYMIVYYRALGLVVVLGLGVGGSLLYAILTQLSYTAGLALTLSGVTGIIVSIGITVDSYVVYFERLKDEVRSGKTIRASVERGFSRAFRTVLTADLVSFLAALILYLFTVGDVRGFAFTLGLSTLLDVFTAYFFIRPIVVLLGRRRSLSRGRFLGIARGLGVGVAGSAA
ncbi:MAG: protein translocase subunit SecD [Acidimicrobiales bacterium]